MSHPPRLADRLFDRRAAAYEQHAGVQSEAGARLLERLDGLRFEPERILDIGCADGRQCRSLYQRFPKARIIGLDRSTGMLACARARRRWWRREFELIRADGGHLPLADDSVDLIYANLSLGWLTDPDTALRSWRRVLRPGGLALMSVFGPDTLRHWRARVLPDDANFKLPDVLQFGSALIRAGFAEPVLDTDWITTVHPNPSALLRDLRGSALLPAMAAGLGGRPYARQRLGACAGDETQADGACRATWEIVSASAWAPDPGQPFRDGSGEEASVPLASISVRRRD